MTQQYAIQAELHRTQRTITIFGFVFAALGLLLTVFGLRSESLVEIGLGLLIALTAGAAAAILRTLARVEVQLLATAGQIDEIRSRVGAIKAAVQQGATSREHDAILRTIDLAALGRGDPGVLTAATLDRSTFPRLATLLDQAAPDRVIRPQEEGEAVSRLTSAAVPETSDSPPESVLARWETALKNRNLPECRAVFSIVVDVLEPGRVSHFKEQLDTLAEETERSLRDMFSAHARRANYDGLLVVGECICEWLPDRPIAAEFARLKPVLVQRASVKHETALDQDKPGDLEQVPPGVRHPAI